MDKDWIEPSPNPPSTTRSCWRIWDLISKPVLSQRVLLVRDEIKEKSPVSCHELLEKKQDIDLANKIICNLAVSLTLNS